MTTEERDAIKSLAGDATTIEALVDTIANLADASQAVDCLRGVETLAGLLAQNLAAIANA